MGSGNARDILRSDVCLCWLVLPYP